MASRSKTGVIIVAGGCGKRAARSLDDLPKQYRKIGRIGVLERTIMAFLDMETIDWVLPVIGEDHVDLFQKLDLTHKKTP